ncbi:MAG: 23S rRNA (guanosine(2251)-2'-O)-methyltransferase RlmB [Saprospiraceae bacterium]|nr:23S rRNA (guanosine(2251)-2'-O)-methyltransferase RlmB [Saprospiraceae bacterium]
MSQLIFGKNPVLEAFGSGQNIEKVYILATLRGETEIKIRNLCKEHNIPLAKVPEIKLDDLTKKKNHQGLVAMLSPVTYHTMEKVMKDVVDTKGFMVILDNVTDVRNIGAIARSAYYFGASALVLSGNFSGQINEDTVKTSAGAILQIPICRTGSLLSVIADLQNQGIMTYATDVKGKIQPFEADYQHPTAIIMGAEEKGLHYKVLESADETIKIAGSGNFDSLNVSVATGILLYEISRQRK